MGVPGQGRVSTRTNPLRLKFQGAALLLRLPPKKEPRKGSRAEGFRAEGLGLLVGGSLDPKPSSSSHLPPSNTPAAPWGALNSPNPKPKKPKTLNLKPCPTLEALMSESPETPEH